MLQTNWKYIGIIEEYNFNRGIQQFKKDIHYDKCVEAILDDPHIDRTFVTANTRARRGGVPIYFHPPVYTHGREISGDSIINPGRRDACQLHSVYAALARFLAATTPVATRRRRRRRRRPFDACCSPGSGGRRGAASDAADGRRAATGRPGVATPRHYPESSRRKARNFLYVHAFLARWYVRRRLPFDEQLRQTSSGPRLRRRTLARPRARALCSPDRASRR